MADVNANIGVNIDTSEALAQLKSLQRQISQFNTSIVKSSETAALAQKSLTTNLVNSINAIGSFSAELRTVKTTSEQFTASLEGNKFSMREYFRYAGGATKSFGKLFRSEFDTITNVAEERVKRLQTQYIKLGRDTNGAMKAIAVIPKELNMADYGTQVQIAAQRQALFNQLMKQGSTNLINFGKNTQWAGRQLMVGFTIPLSILGSTATRVFMDMETQAIKFKKVYGDLFTTREETQQALTDIQALASMYTKYGIAVSQTVGLAADAAAAGFSGIDLQRQTAEATRLSVLGQIDSQKALETTISLQNAFRSSSAELANQIDFLNAVENQTVVSLDDITTAIPKVAPVIQQLGGDVKDLAFFLAAMKEGGVNASEGANALKSGLAALINPTKRASDMLAGMGINIKGIIETNKGNLRNTVVDFAKALDTLDPLTRARAIEQLFGKFQFARLSTLFDNVTRNGTQAARVLDLASSSVEDLAALSEQELGLTAASSMNKFKKAIEDIKAALIPVGQTFLDAVTPIINFVGGILEKFNDLSSGTKKVITILTVGLGAVGPVLLMTFGLLANGIGNLIKLFLTLRGGYLKLTGQSQVLGEQTQYLTNEQLQAEAVAHSLDQSHAKLIQTLTMETGELNQLVGAYQRATAAMQRFAAGNPGSMAPRRKMAQGGVVVGPGTGTSDSIPAMLSNGETVIPAKQSKKFGGLINGIIADNIPGFRTGLGNYTSVNVAGAWQAAHFGGSHEATGAQIIEMSKGATQAVQNAILNMVNAFENGMERRFTVFTNEVVAMSRAANEGVGTPGSGKSISTALAKEDLTGQGAQVRDIELQRQLQKSGVSIEEIRNINEEITASISEGFDQLGNQASITGDEIDNLINEAYDKVGQTNQKVKDAREQMRQITAVTDPRTDSRIPVSNDPYTKARKTGKYYKGMEQIAGAGSIPYTEVGRFNITNDMASKLGMTHRDAADVFKQFSGEIQIKLSKLKGDIAQFAKEFAIEAKKSGLVIGNATIDGIAEATQSKSPSRKAIIQGKNVADGMKIGLLDNKGQVISASKQVGDAAIGGLLGPTGQPINSGKRFSDISSGRNIPETNIINTKSVEKMKEFDQKLSKMNNAIMGGTFALTSLAAIGSTASGTLGDISGQISKYSGLLFALMTVTQLLTQAKVLELAATRAGTVAKAMGSAGGVKGLFTTGAGIASFGKNIATAASFALRFAGPIGIATTVVGLSILAYKRHTNNLEENRKKVQAFGDTLGNASAAAKTVGEYFNYVPNKSNLSRAKGISPTISGERKAIDAFVGSEQFKSKEVQALVSSTSKLNNQDAQSALTLAGFKMLGEGAAKEDVQTFINAILEEAGKTNVKIDFKSFDFSKDGLSKVQTEFDKQVGTLADSYKKGYKTIFETKQDSAGINYLEPVITQSDELKTALINQSQTISTYLDGLNLALSTGTISSKQFKQSFTNFTDSIIKNTPNASAAIALLNQSLAKTNPELAKNLEGYKNLGNQLLVIQATMMGVALASDEMLLRALSGKTEAGGGEAARDRRDELSWIEKLKAEMDKAAKVADDFAKKKGSVTGGTGEKSWLQKLQDQTQAVLTQTDAFYKMRDAGIEAGIANELASNPEFAKGISEAAAKAGDTWKAALSAIKAYTKAQKDLQLAEIAGMDRGDYELQRLNKAQAYIDLQSHFIQMQYSAQLDSIDKAQQENDLLLQRIAYQETLINNRYNPIIDRLQKIQELNRSIAEIEAKRVDVISALTSGDIAGGVRALTELRSTRASQTGQSQIDNLNAARERELALVKQNNLTKEQIDLQNQKLSLDKKEIESTIAKQTANLTYFNMTKLQIDNAAKSLDLAKSAGIDINNPTFLNNILDAAVGKTTALKIAADEAAKSFAAMLGAQTAARTTNIPSAAPVAPTAQTPQQWMADIVSKNVYRKMDRLGLSTGGMVPKYFASGGLSRGTDTIPAMLTPGEYVVRKSAVDALGVGALNNINNGKSSSNSVYNYSLSVNVDGTSANANDIARMVMSEIKKVDQQRIRGVR